jgi:hypothetical protein
MEGENYVVLLCPRETRRRAAFFAELKASSVDRGCFSRGEGAEGRRSCREKDLKSALSALACSGVIVSMCSASRSMIFSTAASRSDFFGGMIQGFYADRGAMHSLRLRSNDSIRNNERDRGSKNQPRVLMACGSRCGRCFRRRKANSSCSALRGCEGSG